MSQKGIHPEEADQLYAELMELHQGLNPTESTELNARLILLLIEQIGDAKKIREAYLYAKAN